MILLTPYKHYYEQIDGKTIDITDEIPFDLPDSWAWCRLGILCKIKGGKRVPKGDDLLDEPTPYVYLRVTDMKAGTICDFKKKYISEETFKKIANYTISKDAVDYHLQFRPGVHYPIGTYIDVPDDVGEYHTWLIVARSDEPQFVKYNILKCNWTFKWMDGEIVRECLGVLRSRNSYNSGLTISPLSLETLINQSLELLGSPEALLATIQC